jgi:beta-1,4-mannosyl-glycoprotein beta-1,4-N-acetylglucosaminyltransferase
MVDKRARRLLALGGALLLLLLLHLSHLRLAYRDAAYLLRPLWDRPESGFTVLPHYARPRGDVSKWCSLHGWPTRPTKPVIVDAVPVASELDLVEIRMREGAGLLDYLVVVEANASFSGAPKPLYFAAERARFDALARETGVEILYGAITTFRPVPKGDMSNEHTQRDVVSGLINSLRERGNLPDGSVVLMADADEVVSRDTLELLAACEAPDVHLNLASFRYSFAQPLRDGGTWRPRAHVVRGEVGYSHGRGTDVVLADAGWHCSFCFRTLEEMRAKMAGYGHNDRLSSPKLLEEGELRARVCAGEDPFDMFPVSPQRGALIPGSVLVQGDRRAERRRGPRAWVHGRAHRAAGGAGPVAIHAR